MSQTLAIDVKGMTKRFGARTVVDAIDLQVRAGETVSLGYAVGVADAGAADAARIVDGLRPLL